MCTTTILWVLYSGSGGGLPSRNLNSLWGYGFFKKGFKSNGFQLIVWSQNLRFFLLRISSQIWRFSKKLRFSHFSFGLVFKRISSQKRLVLHVLCPSHPCASLARTVLKLLSFWLVPCSHSRSYAIDLLPPSCEVKSEEMTKWFFDFPETYIYYTLCIYPC